MPFMLTVEQAREHLLNAARPVAATKTKVK
jgi:hypothetical protein